MNIFEQLRYFISKKPNQKNLWQQGTDSVHDMRVVNTDRPTHKKKYPEKCLHEAERGKKKIYLEACLQQRWHFSPFVASVDGLLVVEVTANLKSFSTRRNRGIRRFIWRLASSSIGTSPLFSPRWTG